MFFPSSRYYGKPTLTYETPNGEPIVYAAPRTVPIIDPANVRRLVQVQIVHRLDLIAFAQLGDPELFWGIADVNPVLDPFSLTEKQGQLVAIPKTVSSGGGQ
jgi:hypothetical protein